MRRLIKLSPLFIFLITLFVSNGGFSQSKRKPRTLRDNERRAMHSRDSLLRTLNKSDTSINSLLQRIEQYTTTFNQINNNLSAGLDTSDIGQKLPPIVKRINKIDSLLNTHKSSTLRYLFVLRDNLDRMQDQLEGWQSDLEDIGTTLIQNQKDLIKFTKDSLVKASPNDSLLRNTFFSQRKAVIVLWRRTDAANRTALLKVNFLQDKLAIAYTNELDESELIDSKISKFADRAVAGEFGYIWETAPLYRDFNSALNSTLKVNKLLFNYFINNQTLTHCAGLVFLILVLAWLAYNRRKTIRHNEQFETIFEQANYIYKKPVISSLLVATAITPYFYSHPPVVFTEIIFLVPMILVLVFVKKEFSKTTFNFLLPLFLLTLIYSVSNLFIEISNIDRIVILLLSIISIITGLLFLRKLKKVPEGLPPYSDMALKVFIGLQSLSLIFNITGRFSLAKIVGVTAAFNLWMLLILYFVIQIISQGLFLQFQTKKEENSILNWIDYTIVQEKFRKILTVLAALLWLFFLLQNLNIDDWATDYVSGILSQSRSVAGASFTFGGFVIFIAVIWLSSMASKIISYFYDVSAQRVNDLSVLKKKNRTSILLIRLGVFSIGFLLAVAASNFPLDKITIIISAFGVGIGFGLQNIVNNLVSGLILAFEKPIQIGDIIEVDGVSGTMKEIGIRSSKVLTSDGSEVIIPNGDLISHHVINWTLSNSNRRIELIVRTAYGSDIDKIKELLKNLLTNRDDIMTTPSFSLFLHNVSESSVDFRIFFWAADISNTLELKSRVLADIYHAFKQEGIEVPSAQKDFFLHFPDGESVLNADKKTNEKKDRDETKTDPNKNPPDEAK
jgi:potassium efflux system protein